MIRFKMFFSLLVLIILLCTNSDNLHAQFAANNNLILSNWLIQSSDSVPEGGMQISKNNYDAKNWFIADVPSTVLHTLVKNGIYENIYENDNLEKIPTKAFRSSWWYRSNFEIQNFPTAIVLNIEGINYKANIWLNGNIIADSSEIKNAFRQFKLDITENCISGNNTLAIEVFPPKAGDFSIGFVDWNPTPPDNNMGLFRNVSVSFIDKGILQNPFVVSQLNANYTEAKLTVSVDIVNYSNKQLDGIAVFSFDGKEVKKNIIMSPNQKQKIVFNADDFTELQVKNPKLWWPHTIGNPNLYTGTFKLIDDKGNILSETDINFGIRSVSDYYTKDGHRGFIINGEKVLIRGGGWVDRLLLDDTPESIRSQLNYVVDMNLNTIRLEGFWGKDQTLYNLCDELGILVMVGWSCHWEWEDYLGIYCDEKYGGITSSSDIEMMGNAWQDQIIWLRNHPSIFSWVGGSDCVPKPELEKKYFEIFSEYDSTRVYLASAKEWTIPSGNTGVKMRGPYAYVPPIYWYADTLFGGAFGFNTETSPGSQVPPAESIMKMITKQYRWPINEIWDYHCGRNEFNTLDRYTKALVARYGEASNLEDYAKKAQLLNYELMRPMFEAFSANRYDATGVIQWMLNSAWPEMYWQLYDYYLMPNGAYYGAKKASQPHHAIYNYANNSITVVNDKLQDKNNCTLKIRVYKANSELVYEKEIKTDLVANSSTQIANLPEKNWGSPTYFLDLRLYDKSGNEIDINFYWLSAKQDLLDYEASVPSWYYHTPSKQYADYTALNTLPKVVVISSLSKVKNENTTKYSVKLKNNTDKIAFFVNPQLVDTQTNKAILPILWSDNYISLLPYESRTISAIINNNNLNNINPQLVVDGYNLKNK